MVGYQEMFTTRAFLGRKVMVLGCKDNMNSLCNLEVCGQGVRCTLRRVMEASAVVVITFGRAMPAILGVAGSRERFAWVDPHASCWMSGPRPFPGA